MSSLFRQTLLRSGTSTSRSVVNATWRRGQSLGIRLLSNEVKSRIDGAVKSAPLVVFMKGTPDLPQCGFSRAVCQILEVQGVEQSKIKTFNVLEDMELREGIKEYSQWPTIPQVYINGEFLGGCDIMLQSHQSGALEEQLAKEGLVAAEAAPAS